MTKRAVLYARVSADDRRYSTSSVDGQLADCRAYAESMGYEIIGEFFEDKERLTSGAAWLPEIERVLDMALEGRFDVLIVREMDRLARSLAKQLIVEEELKRGGATIEYVLEDYDETPEGRLTKNIKASIAEYNRVNAVQKMVRGVRRAVRAGSVIARVEPYGYALLEDASGRYSLETREDEAAVIRLIFAWYLEGDASGRPLGMAKISRKLSELRIPTFVDNRGYENIKKTEVGIWSIASVANILKNETYAGVWRYGKRGGIVNGRRSLNDESRHITLEVPAIVKRATWEAAQKQMRINKRWAKKTPKHNYLLNQRVICGECGYKMCSYAVTNKSGKTYLYYRCLAQRDRGIDCPNAPFPCARVDAVVWQFIREILVQPDQIIEAVDNLRAATDEQLAPIRERVATIDGLIGQRKAELNRLVDLYIAGRFDKGLLFERQQRLEETIAGLEQERAIMAGNIEQTQANTEYLQALESFIAGIAEGLEEAEQDFTTRRALMERLDVVVKLKVVDGDKRVSPRCIIPLGREYLSLTNPIRNAE